MIITQLRINIISCSWSHIKAPALCYQMVPLTPYCFFRHETRYVQINIYVDKSYTGLYLSCEDDDPS